MTTTRSSSTARRLAFAAALATGAAAVHADSLPRVPLLNAYQQECGSCHTAFPPGLLSAPSWQRLMNSLPRHFGTDASLDAATAQRIGDWLATHAGSGKRAAAAPPEDRITRSPWFVREHREVPAATWALAAVKQPSNCAACHPGADRGDFDEHELRIPR